MRNLSRLGGKGSAAIVGLALVFGAVGCPEEDTEPGGGNGGAGGETTGGSGGPTAGAGGGAGAGGVGGGGGGEPTCGLSHCESGQHCNNGICVNGCLTAANCLANQTCEDIDGDTNIGTCRDAAVAPTKDCTTFCSKAMACFDPEAVICDQKCAALSTACVACVNDSNCGAGCDSLCEM